MGTNEMKSSLKMALEKLRIAEYELYRPSEDVATLSVCLTARQYMRAMMRFFLLNNSIGHNEEESLSNLLNQCKAVDTQFDSIDLSEVYCCEMNRTECENNYCLSIEKVNNCLAIANQVKLIVMNKFNEIE